MFRTEFNEMHFVSHIEEQMYSTDHVSGVGLYCFLSISFLDKVWALIDW